MGEHVWSAQPLVRHVHAAQQVLHQFLQVYGSFDWDSKCLTLQGAVPLAEVAHNTGTWLFSAVQTLCHAKDSMHPLDGAHEKAWDVQFNSFVTCASIAYALSHYLNLQWKMHQQTPLYLCCRSTAARGEGGCTPEPQLHRQPAGECEDGGAGVCARVVPAEVPQHHGSNGTDKQPGPQCQQSKCCPHPHRLGACCALIGRDHAAGSASFVV